MKIADDDLHLVVFDDAAKRSQLWPHLDHIDHSLAVVQKLDENVSAKIQLERTKMCRNLHHYSQCAEEKSNESVEDMDGTFAGW